MRKEDYQIPHEVEFVFRENGEFVNRTAAELCSMENVWSCLVCLVLSLLLEHAPEFDYTMWSDGSGYGGGFNKVSEENPAGQVLVYIASDDLEADLKKVEELGGTAIAPKTEIPGTGWFGLFKDPTGNTLALYTSMNPDFNK